MQFTCVQFRWTCMVIVAGANTHVCKHRRIHNTSVTCRQHVQAGQLIYAQYVVVVKWVNCISIVLHVHALMNIKRATCTCVTHFIVSVFSFIQRIMLCICMFATLIYVAPHIYIYIVNICMITGAQGNLQIWYMIEDPRLQWTTHVLNAWCCIIS